MNRVARREKEWESAHFSGVEGGNEKKEEKDREKILRLPPLVWAGVLILILLFSHKLERIWEDFWFWYLLPTADFVHPPQLYLAEAIRPFRVRQIEKVTLEARAAIVVELKKNGQTRILFAQNSAEKLPIASLSKLMAASIILENYNLEDKIEISASTVAIEGDKNNFEIGKVFRVRELLYPMLIESSNQATFALTEKMGEAGFVTLMNERAKEWGMGETRFFNATGLDPDDPQLPVNFSTVADLGVLVHNLLREPVVLWQILGTSTFKLFDFEGIFHHRVENTNQLLEEYPAMRGGKTGSTPRAGECLLVVLESPGKESYLVAVILGSSDRFGEMKELIDWVDRAYHW